MQSLWNVKIYKLGKLGYWGLMEFLEFHDILSLQVMRVV